VIFTSSSGGQRLNQIYYGSYSSVCLCRIETSHSLQIFICNGHEAEYIFSRSFREAAVASRRTSWGNGESRSGRK